MNNVVSCFLAVCLIAACAYPEKATCQIGERHASASEMLNGITQKHPVTYIQLAAELFNQGKKDEAVVWYYVGQMRYRAHLMANPDLEPSGEPALYSSLMQVVGQPINEYAGSDADNWERLITKAIAWNAEHENAFTPKSRFPEIYREVEDNFMEFKKYVAENKADIIKARKENGLSGG
ncbi:hypothetical protein [Aeromonas diversa]|uniref:hypothetical protein n=1 Tax=Aeromonas diversa TaxID=502790 RepID=UPI003462A8D3